MNKIKATDLKKLCEEQNETIKELRKLIESLEELVEQQKVVIEKHNRFLFNISQELKEL